VTDKEKIILSVAGSLATIGLGYLIWRHEQTISAASSATNIANQQAVADEQDQEIQQELDSIPSLTTGGGGGISDGVATSGSDANIDSAGTDSNIAAILAAFFPNTTTSSTTTSSTASNPSTNSGGTETPPPVVPVTPVTATPVGPAQPVTKITGGPVISTGVNT
jgi:hypothetical protein